MEEPLSEATDADEPRQEIDETEVVDKIVAFLAEGGDGQITLEVRDGAIVRAKFDRFVYEDPDAEEASEEEARNA
jgi:hypothetical protein